MAKNPLGGKLGRWLWLCRRNLDDAGLHAKLSELVESQMQAEWIQKACNSTPVGERDAFTLAYTAFYLMVTGFALDTVIGVTARNHALEELARHFAKCAWWDDTIADAIIIGTWQRLPDILTAEVLPADIAVVADAAGLPFQASSDLEFFIYMWHAPLDHFKNVQLAAYRALHNGGATPLP